MLGRSRLFVVSVVVAVWAAACSSDPSVDPGGGDASADAPTTTSASCTNGTRDDGEEGVHCGGPCPRCDGAECVRDEDCASGGCTNGTCDPPPTKTCGVGLPALCANGEPCAQDADCTSDYCDGTCAAPPANVHEDGRRNGGETGVDCGGTATGKPCPAGQGCKTSDDCESTCNAQKLCDAPSSTDGKKNNEETDVDCGGPNAPKCALGKACVGNDDCELLACTQSACVQPTSTDGVKNGGESDVDCGGPGVAAGGFSYTPPRCKDGRTCAADGDCVTNACSPAGRCVVRSCDTAETAGITTCGAKEVGDVTAVHESCCKSLQLPTRSRRLDKYEITAGRFRTFLNAVGPNVRQWVQTFVAANPTHPLATMIASYPVVQNLYPAAKTGPLNLIAHMAMDIDNYDGIRGCYNGTGSYGHNTYWMDPTDLDDLGLPARPLARAVTDAKSLNCAMPMMFAAFCAWDGGELALLADLLDAWGAGTYPWGAADLGRPNYNWCNGDPGTGGFTCQDTSLGVNGTFYRFPGGTNLANDFSPLIASPGRFVMDASALKRDGESWMDLFANFPEYTGDIVAPATTGNLSFFCDFSAAPAAGATTCTRNRRAGQLGTRYNNIPRVRILGRSWEGHQYNKGNSTAFPVTFQYGKFGARCARPVQ